MHDDIDESDSSNVLMVEVEVVEVDVTLKRGVEVGHVAYKVA